MPFERHRCCLDRHTEEYHEHNTGRAARKAKHVICEKPMAHILEDCDQLLNARDLDGVKLLLYAKASDWLVVKISEGVNSGRLGRMIQINTWNYKGGLTQARIPSRFDTLNNLSAIESCET